MSKSSKAGSKRSRRNQKKCPKQVDATTLPSLTVDQLRSGLSTLPQELCDIVFAAVFAIPSSDARYVGRLTYKSPVQLQINRQTRDMFSANYYSAEASWIFLCDWHSKPSPDTIGRWWTSLDKKAKTLLCRPRQEALSFTTLVVAKGVSKGELLRYPSRTPFTKWFNFWYRWAVDGQEGIGKLFEVVQFLSPSDDYDGISR